MSFFARFSSRAWVPVLLLALGFLVWTDGRRVQRIRYVSGLAGWSVEAPAFDAGSPTGYAKGQRALIVAERSDDSYHWIMQTQQMLAKGEWRVRQVDYDNAPFGREVYSASPYRWWLGLVAWCDHAMSGRSLGLAAEQAALLADPIFHALLVLGLTLLVAWRFGSGPAALLALGLVLLFPFGGVFPPGATDPHGFVQACALGAVLLLLVGMHALPAGTTPTKTVAAVSPATPGPARRCFMFAGVAGGLGLWLKVDSMVPIIAGIAVGAMLATWIARGTASTGQIPDAGLWRAWALGGAATVFVAYLLEYFPARMGDWQLEAIHPVYGIAWLGGGELLARIVAWIRQGVRPRGPHEWGGVALAVLALAALPVAMGLTKNPGFLSRDILSFRLSNLPDGVLAPSLLAWLTRDGFSGAVCASLLPLSLIGWAVWQLVRRTTSVPHRAILAVALGPVLVALGLACGQLRWFSLLDSVWLALLVGAAAAQRATSSPVGFKVWLVLVLGLLAPGLSQLVPSGETGKETVLSGSEMQGLIERDVGYWLAKTAAAPDEVILAPPSQTAVLCYYGGVRGVGTFCRENKDGLAAAIRIASVGSPEEAHALIDGRGISRIVVPSWDVFFKAYQHTRSDQAAGSFISALFGYALPGWVRPVPYQLPNINGFEGHYVSVFSIGDEQDEVVALSRLAEYYVEMDQLDFAASVSKDLQRFPADLGALTARANVAIARGDQADFYRTVELLRRGLAGPAERRLLWDRRASLVVVLARAKQMELAKAQAQRCLAAADQAKLRQLTAGSLYRLQVLAKLFELEIADPALRAFALDLLPPASRSRL